MSLPFHHSTRPAQDSDMHFFELRTRSISVCMSVIRQTDSGMRVVRQLPSAGGSRAHVLIRIRQGPGTLISFTTSQATYFILPNLL